MTRNMLKKDLQKKVTNPEIATGKLKNLTAGEKEVDMMNIKIKQKGKRDQVTAAVTRVEGVREEEKNEREV